MAAELAMKLPKNLGDILYALRFRIGYPETIVSTQPDGQEWVIEGAGRARYRFRLVKATRIFAQ